MNRLTCHMKDSDTYQVPKAMIAHDEDGCKGAAVEKLARYENFHENLLLRQKELSTKLEKLRSEGRTRSATFHQMLAEKLANQNILILLEGSGLENPESPF